MQPDRDQIEVFVDGLFRHASPKGFVSLRSFYEEDAPKPFRISAAGLSGGLRFLVDVAEDDATRAANAPKPVVFCPPIAVFADKDRARERDIVEGLALSVECDQHPYKAKVRLEALLGPATIVIRSGGKWIDPTTRETHDKLHLHWRLSEPARGEELSNLKRARDMAARLVDGDPSNKPVCHPIRWPGSWHRKGEPILCEIEGKNPDHEIDLDTALAALTAACPEQLHAKANGKGHSAGASGGTTSWAEQVQSIISGESYHSALTSLAAKMLTAGMSDGAAVNLLRALMESAIAPRDDRWEVRYGDIPRTVSTAREKFGSDAAAQTEAGTDGRLVVSSAEFVKDFVPPDYLVDGLLQRRYCYALTARTGDGKTALALLLAACVALGVPFGGHATERGRVLFFAGENPDDIRARWIAMSVSTSFDIDAIDVHFIPGTFKISAMVERIAKEVKALGGVALIIVDTSAAYFEGSEENDNVQQGAHARRLRNLVNLPGGPCVLTNCHPVKNAGDDNLNPRGGGAFVAEIDGNLTALRDDTAVVLHWQVKFRGPDFAPISFVLRTDRRIEKEGTILVTSLDLWRR
jgi:hypothetical protein